LQGRAGGGPARLVMLATIRRTPLNSVLGVLWVAPKYILDAFALGDRDGERIQILPETGRQG
jgi:hypothetical protein